MIFEIINRPPSGDFSGGSVFVFDIQAYDGYDVWSMLEAAFPDHRKPGLSYYGLYHYGQYENAIFFPNEKQ